MKTNNDQVKTLCKGSAGFDEMARLKALKPFSELTMQFLGDLSASILRDSSYKQYNDVISFAFFIRRANLQKLKSEAKIDISARLGRGLVFHIAPSNVPVNFAYSLVAGLLSGNANIIKVSSRDFEQVRLLCKMMTVLLDDPKYTVLADYIAIIQYANEPGINDYFSSLCHVRVIWGGDQTIAQLRKSPLPPRSFDVTFANRYSICLINAGAYLVHPDKNGMAVNFYNDTYRFDQNACFSPRLVYWTGTTDEVNRAKELFWKSLYDYAYKMYPIEDGMATEKQMAMCRTILDNQDINVEKSADNLITRCETTHLKENILDGSCANGFFIEYAARGLDGLKQISSKKIQTLSYFGYTPKELADFVMEHGLPGIDRIVEIGKAHEFSLIWDGYDLLSALTRVITY